MAIVYLTRKYHFAASHRLYNPNLSDAENFEIFRECSFVNGHGHNYELEVTVKGNPDARTGMVIDIVTIDEIVREKILTKCDHRHLNLDVDFLTNIIPTTENIVKAFWDELRPEIRLPVQLHRLKLQESRNNSAECLRQD